MHIGEREAEPQPQGERHQETEPAEGPTEGRGQRGGRGAAGGGSAARRFKGKTFQGESWSGRKLSQGLFSSTLYPGTDLDSPERLAASFLGVAALSLGLGRPWSGSSWPSGRPSPSDAWPEELSCRANEQAFSEFTQV